MSFKLESNVFFKKISEDQVNILLADDDNYIFKLNKVAAQVFLMLIDEKIPEADVRKKVLELTKKPESDVDAFLTKFYKEMVEQKFLVKS